MERRGENYFVCRLCQYWTEDEDDMVYHISTRHDVSRVKDGISDLFARFPPRIDSIYDGIELCIQKLTDTNTLTEIRNRLLSQSMDKILRVIEKEQEKSIHVVAAELDYSV